MAGIIKNGQVYTGHVTDEHIRNIVEESTKLKTYTSLEQLGIDTTTAVTTGTIFNALPQNSSLNCFVSLTVVSDLPNQQGLLIITKTTKAGFDILFKRSGQSSKTENSLYVGQLKGEDGSGLTWLRLCTTSVANIDVTNVTIPSDLFPTFNANSSYIKYDVTNGICTVYVALREAKRSTSIGDSVLSVPLPAPKSGKIEHSIKSEGNYFDLTIIITNGTTLMWSSGDGSTICNYLGSFSYPVAKS